MSRVGVALALAALGAVACSSPERIQSSGAAVRGGVEAPDDTSVVGVVNFSGGQCSGSLIAPRLVLTARHCVADTAGKQLEVVCGETKFEPPDSPGAIFVVPRPTISENPDDYAAVSAIAMQDEDDDLCGTDLVLLVLKEPLLTAAPLEPRLNEPVRAGESYSAIGYGIDEAVEGKPSGVRKRLDGLTVTCSGSDCAEGADVRDNEWVGSGGPCSGDSGGPALDEQGRVIGVVSRGKSGCSEPVFGDVASRAEWLKGRAIAVANDAHEAPPFWAPCTATLPCGAPAQADEVGSSCSVARAAPANAATRAWPLLLLAAGLVLRRFVAPKNVSGHQAQPS